MTTQELEELRQLIELQRELTRQRLRGSLAEAWVDDVQQKLALNRAVYAAGYGIAPKPSAAEPCDSKPPAPGPAPAPAPAPAAAQPTLWSKAWPWILAGAAGLGAAGVPVWQSLRPSVSVPAPVPVYDVQRWVPE